MRGKRACSAHADHLPAHAQSSVRFGHVLCECPDLLRCWRVREASWGTSVCRSALSVLALAGKESLRTGRVLRPLRWRRVRPSVLFSRSSIKRPGSFPHRIANNETLARVLQSWLGGGVFARVDLSSRHRSSVDSSVLLQRVPARMIVRYHILRFLQSPQLYRRAGFKSSGLCPRPERCCCHARRRPGSARYQGATPRPPG